MKFNKQVAVILVLLSMLLSAIAVAIYFYKQNQKTILENNQLVKIFVAKENIKRNIQLTAKDIKETTIARQFVLTKPLLKKEIIGKFTKEAIYKNEVFLKEKLSTKIIEKEVKNTSSDYKYSSYNMSFKLFKNPNYSLEPNDIIKIISVYPAGTKDAASELASPEYAVQYVANNIKILGFLNNGQSTEKSIVKKKIKKLVKKQQVEEIIEIKSQEIILDIKQDILLSLINDYNKGKQLWMVKSKFEEEAKNKEDEIEEIVEKKKVKTVINKKKRKYTPRSYPIKWYKAKSSSSTKTATISYSNDNDFKQTKKATILSNFAKECSQKENLLLVKSSKAYIRKHPSIRAKIDKKVYKNYVIPYTSISRINPSWFMICDGNYIQSKDVKEITYKEYKKLRK